MAQQI